MGKVYNEPDYIEIRIVESVLKDNNGIELKWLKGILESNIQVMSEKGRHLKKDRFLKRIEELQNGKESKKENSSPTQAEQPRTV